MALLIPVLLGVSLVVFTLVRLIPGMPRCWRLGSIQRITAEQRELVRKSYGLDQPQPVQYARWMQHVLQGDLGTSLRTRRSVNEELWLRLPVTIELTLLAALLGTVPAMAVGVLAAVRRNSALDYAATIGTLIGVSVPNFLLATLLVSLWLRWLPPIGYVELTKDPIENLRTMLSRRQPRPWPPSSCEHCAPCSKSWARSTSGWRGPADSPSGGSSAAT